MGWVSQATDKVANTIADPAAGLTNLAKDVSQSPVGQAAITVGAAMAGIPPAATAAALGANQASQTGNISNGLTTGLLSYGGGTLANSSGLTGTLNNAVSGVVGGAAPATTGAITTGGLAGATPAEIAAANAAAGGSSLLPGGLGSMAASSAVPTAAEWSALGTAVANGSLPAAALGGVASGATTASSLLSTIGKNAGLVGAGLGALAGGQTSTTTANNTKEPWGPAQAWLKANLASGQALQNQYMANPFSAFQKQAYNNSAQLGNVGRSNLQGILGQMGQRQAFNPRQPSTVTPYQFGQFNLGMTSTPFPGA